MWFHGWYWYQSFIDGSNIWGVDRTDPWGPEMDHLPLGRSYLVVVPSYDMPCALILLTGLYGCDIDINPSSMYFISHRIHAIRDVATPSINIHAYWDQSSRRKYIPTLIGIFYMLIWHPQYTMIRSANHFFLSLSRFFFLCVCVIA